MEKLGTSEEHKGILLKYPKSMKVFCCLDYSGISFESSENTVRGACYLTVRDIEARKNIVLCLTKSILNTRCDDILKVHALAISINYE